MNSALVERSTVLAPAARASLRGIKPLFSKSMAAPLKAAFRVTFWGALAMALTAGVGALFGAAV